MTETVGTTGGAGTSMRAIEVVRGFYDALAGGDVPGMVAFLDPELEWRAPESLPWGGTFRGHDGFREFIGKLAVRFNIPVVLSTMGVEMGIREPTIARLAEALPDVTPIVPAPAWATEPALLAA